MAVRDNEVINLNTDEEIKKVLDLLGLTGDTGGSETKGTTMAKLNELLKINPAMEAFLRTGGIFSKNIEFAVYGKTFSFTETGQTDSTEKTLTEDFYITCAYSNRDWSNLSSALSVTYEVNSVTFNVPTEREHQNGYGLYTITGLQTYTKSGTIEAPSFNLFPIPIYRVAKAGTVLKFKGKANNVPGGEEKATIYLYGFYIR